MEINIQSVRFDATDALIAFVNKKLEKMARKNPDILQAQVIMKVVKPETANNKEAQILLRMPQREEIVSAKIADTFEEAIDNAIAALEPQLEKIKCRR